MAIQTLDTLPTAVRRQGPLVIAVMDGIGWGCGDAGDAVHNAATVHLDRLWRAAPTRTLAAHGPSVGLPSVGDMGNSEVGHNAMGAGRVVRQGAALVQDAIANGSLFRDDCWLWLTEPLVGQRRGSLATLHLCGLLSDGNVHSHIDHVEALLEGAHQSGVDRIRIHALADGRDVVDPSYESYLEILDESLRRYKEQGRDYAIASGGGRMVVTMDRYESDWRIVERGWRAHVHGDAAGFHTWAEAVATLRGQSGGQSDQTLGPFCLLDSDGQAVGPVRDGDGFIFWNFRGDRALQLTRAFESGAEFDGFDRGRVPEVRFAGMMQYDGDELLPSRFLVDPPIIERTMGEYAVVLGLRTLATSETQKFGHVTYFWNGNRSGRLDDKLERYVEVPSGPQPFDHFPAMRAREITDVVQAALAQSTVPDIIRINYANGDMVGHTGNLSATISAVEAVDAEIGRLVALVQRCQGVLVVTADHGNADDMWMRDGAGQPRQGTEGLLARTSHTLAPVPFTVFDTGAGASWQLRDDLPEAGLGNIAATCLELLGYRPPEEMAPSLLHWPSR